jgi:pyruvate ferredoxin oxidoreductase gamma subunit
MKTASRILGSALFREGYEVQDAPRYAAERRGAPIFAYVRADRRVIHERGVIDRPDLVVVADESLILSPAAGVLAGVGPGTTLLIATAQSAGAWKERLNFPGRVLTVRLFTDLVRDDVPLVGVSCAAAAARLLGAGLPALEASVGEELGALEPALLARNLERARAGFAELESEAGSIVNGDHSVPRPSPPDWIVLPFESARTSAPAIHAVANSVEVRTGLWRLLRPVVDAERCHGCWWICSSQCPDGVIAVVDGRPQIDYEHCKGCMVCVSVCPHHAIEAVPERSAQTVEVHG